MEQLINDILRKRNEQVPEIETQITVLKSILQNLKDYDNLRLSIIDSEGNLKEDSQYGYLIRYPEVVASIFDASPNDLYPAINEHIERLERLKQRFGRKSLTIQIFGGAGSGKSTFIQSITNLDNNVVMAAEGDHCTGTTSYIRNINEERFEARIYPYTKYEILKIFNDGLKETLIAKNLKEYSINSFDEIENFNLQSIGLSITDYVVSHYITNFNTIKSVLSEVDTKGILDEENNRRYIKIEDPKNVQQYIAHHNDYKTSDPKYKTYKKYLAVKFVRVFTKFNHSKAGKIELLDSVGFGDIATKSLVEKGMYQSIADNCDIVTIICCPFKRSDIAQAAETMDKARYKGELPIRIERISGSCLFLVLNNDRRPDKNNTDYCEYSKSVWTNGMNPKVDSPLHRTETILCADLHEPKETEVNVLVPILKQVTENLPNIDQNIKKEVNDKTLELQEQFNSFVQKISNVLIVNPTGGGHAGFITRFKNIYERELRIGLNSILKEAKDDINHPAAELGRRLKVKCNQDSIAGYIKALDTDIYNINPAATPAEWLDSYEKLASKLAHSIPNNFKEIDIELNDIVANRKATILNCLYDNGKFNTILKRKDDSTESTLEWGAKLNEFIVTEVEYPTLHNIIKELLTFNISIDGLLLFRIIKHFDELLKEENVPNAQDLKQGGEKAMSFYLDRNLNYSFDKIKPELENFTTSPNEAIYYALDSFVYNLLYHPRIKDECILLYQRYENKIWREDLESIQAQTVALDDWKNIRDKMKQFSIKTL